MAKAAQRSSEKGRPSKSASFCASSILFIHSGMQVLLVENDGRRRRSVMKSARLIPPLCLARSSGKERVVKRK